MRSKFFVLNLIVIMAILAPPAAISQVAVRQVADGSKFFRNNRLISIQSETGSLLYRPVEPAGKLFFDGKLDGSSGDSFWSMAQTVSPFVADGGDIVQQGVSARVTYDRENIYIFWQLDAGKPVATVAAADTSLDSDSYVQVDLYPIIPDSIIHGRGYYYSVAANALGTVQDVYYDPYREGFFFSSWNSGALTAVELNKKGWTLEMKIPFAGLDLYSDSGWDWILEFHYRDKGVSSSARQGTRVTQGVDVRRPAWVTYYWDRPELMHDLQPNAAEFDSFHAETAVPAVTSVYAVNSAADVALFSAAPANAITLSDDTAEPLDNDKRASFRVVRDNENLYVQFLSPEGRVVKKDKSGDDGSGMGAQMEGINGVFKDMTLLSTEGFWLTVQPRVPGGDGIHQDYYFISIDNAGNYKSIHYSADGIPDRSWDMEASLDTFNHGGGWGAEITIPLASLDIPAGCGTVWGLNAFHNSMETEKGELAAWVPTRGHNQVPDHLGTASGLEFSYDSLIRESLKRRLTRVQARLNELSVKDGLRSEIRDIQADISSSDTEELDYRIESLEQDLGRLKAIELNQTEPKLSHGLNQRLNDICFLPDGMNGWAVGRQGTILATVDGGQTWAEQKSNTSADLSRVRFTDAKHGWIAGGRVRNAPSNAEMRHDERGGFGYILATEDGGKTWDIQYAEEGRYLFGLTMIDSERGWVCGEGGILLNTDDGGKHWSYTANSGTRRWLFDIAFEQDGVHGFAAGEAETLLETGDSGQSWTVRKISADLKFYGFEVNYKSLAIRGNKVWMVGQNGTILGSTDSGKTWNVQTSYFDPAIRSFLDLYKVHFADNNTGWAVGRHGARALVTADGGKSWRLAPVDSRAQLGGIWLDGKGKVAISGELGRIMISDDNGESWTLTNGDKDEKLDILALMAHGDDGPLDWGPLYAYWSHREGLKVGDIQMQRDAHSVEYEGEIYNLEHNRSAIQQGCVVADYGDEQENGNNGSDYYHFTQRCWEGDITAIRASVAWIRKFRPEVVLTHEPVFGDYDKPGHKIAGRAAFEAFMTAGGEKDLWPELTAIGLEPWQPKKLYCGAGETYPATLDLTAIEKLKVSDNSSMNAVEWANWALTNFQSQGIYYAHTAEMSLMKANIEVPVNEKSVMDGIK